ncbi:putative hexose transport-related protein [Pseudohyphozyma bogoriensis]|nr:putative hexose transport-related protein [Pseudohyphozyma bogoriensis]
MVGVSAKQAGSDEWRNLSNACDTKGWRQNKGLKKLNFFISIIFFGQVLYGYDSSIISSLQTMTPWQVDMGYPSSGRLGMLNALTYVAGVLTAPLISWMGDRYGRKWCLRYYGFTMTIGTVIGVIAGAPGVNGFACFCVSRIFCGTGLVANILTGQVLIQEIAHPRFRALTASTFNTNWAVGALSAAWVTFGCAWITTRWCWRIPYIIQLFPSVYVMIATQFVPESPRWLLAQGRAEEAMAFLVELHGDGDAKDELVLFEFAEMQEALEAEKAARASRWSQMFANPANRKRMGLVGLIACMQQLNGSSIVYYYYYLILDSVGITSSVANTGINAGLYCFDFIMSFFGVWLSTRYKRRHITLVLWPLYAAALFVMATTSGVYQTNFDETTYSGPRGAAIGTVFGLWFIYLSLGSIETPIFFAYPAEILQYSMRTKGMGFNVFVTQIGGIFNTWATPVIYDKLKWKFYLVWAPVVLVQTVFVYFFMVETHGYTLEEIAIAFEGTSSKTAPHVNPSTLEAGSDSNSHKEKNDSYVVPAVSAA